MTITKDLEELDKVQEICEEFLGRKITVEEAQMIGFVFEKGRQYGIKTVIDKITEVV